MIQAYQEASWLCRQGSLARSPYDSLQKLTLANGFVLPVQSYCERYAVLADWPTPNWLEHCWASSPGLFTFTLRSRLELLSDPRPGHRKKHGSKAYGVPRLLLLVGCLTFWGSSFCWSQIRSARQVWCKTLHSLAWAKLCLTICSNLSNVACGSFSKLCRARPVYGHCLIHYACIGRDLQSAT